MDNKFKLRAERYRERAAELLAKAEDFQDPANSMTIKTWPRTIWRWRNGSSSSPRLTVPCGYKRSKTPPQRHPVCLTVAAGWLRNIPADMAPGDNHMQRSVRIFPGLPSMTGEISVHALPVIRAGC